MRIIVSLCAAATLAAASPDAQAENATPEPPETGASAAPAATDKSTEIIKPLAQSLAPKPRESGLDQPLCTGE